MAMQKKNILQEFMGDSNFIPSKNQLIVKYLLGKGNNLHEVESPGLSPAICSVFFLVSMPKKFRQLIWLRKGDCIVIDPIAEGKKVLGEIICVLPLKCVLSLIESGKWPALPVQSIVDKLDPVVISQSLVKTHLINFFNAGKTKTKDSKSSSTSPASSVTSSDNESDSEGDDESSDTSSEKENEEDLMNNDPIPVPLTII